MTIVKWKPMRELDSIKRDMERLVGDFVEPFPARHLLRWPRLSENDAYYPSVELINRGNEYLVRVELPGIDKKDIDLTITDDTLTIKGEAKRSEEVKEDEYLLSEVTYGKFSRTVTVPTEVESGKAKAKANVLRAART